MVLDLEKDPMLIRPIQQATALLEQLEVLPMLERKMPALLEPPVVPIALEEVDTRKPEIPTGTLVMMIMDFHEKMNFFIIFFS